MALTSVTLSIVEQDGSLVLTWAPDDEPTDRWEILRDGTVHQTLYRLEQVTWTDTDVSNNVAYEYVVTGQDDDVSSAAVRAVAGPLAFGVVSALSTTPRYTTLADVKSHMNVNQADETYDDTLTQVVCAIEYAIDVECGRSFPDPAGGAIIGIPEAIKQVALQASIAAYNNTETPAGSGGSDDWFGEQEDSIGEIIRRDVRRNPLLMGFRVSFGIAGGTS